MHPSSRMHIPQVPRHVASSALSREQCDDVECIDRTGKPVQGRATLNPELHVRWIRRVIRSMKGHPMLVDVFAAFAF